MFFLLSQHKYCFSNDFKELLNELKTKNFNKSSNIIKKGIGLGSCWYGCGNTALPNPSTIKVGIDNIGRLFLHQGATDIGQGSNTVITQICADALGVPINVFKLIGPDTQLTPDCGKTSASRQTYISGKAAELAGTSLRKQILRLSNMGLDAVIEFKDKTVKELPQGARKVLDILIAIIGKPKVILLDEPTSGISTDEKNIVMKNILSAIKEFNISVLFIEHDMEIVEKFSERVVAFYNGEIIADDKPSKVFNQNNVKKFIIGGL